MNFIKKNKKDYVQEYSFEISEKYIVRLKDGCEKRGVKFYLMPTPSSDYQKAAIIGLRDEYSRSGLAVIYPNYLAISFIFLMIIQKIISI